jgi:TP901 family phage tail tape measure protein
VANPRDVNVRASLDPSRYEAGAERVTFQTKQMLREQEAADRKWRSMQAAHQAALDEEGRRQAKAAQAVQEAEEKRAQAMERTGQAAAVMGGAILAGLGMSARVAISWESAWAGVTKTVDATPEELAAVEEGLRSLAKTLPASHEEIAAVAEAAGQLGVQSGAIVGFTKTMIDLGETTNLSADEAATSIAQMANVMDASLLQSGDGVQRLGATLVALGNAGASTEADIMATAQRISGAGKLVGATSAEVMALASALTSMGITAELGGGVASRVLQDIYSAVEDGGEKLDAFASVAGVSAEQFAQAFREDPVRALGLFTTGLNGVEASGGNVVKTLSQLGFKSSEEQRVLLQLKGANDLLVDSLDLANEAWDDNTALIDEANKRYASTEAQVEIARNALNDAAIDIGASFLPVIAGAAENVADLAQWFADLPAWAQGTITALGTIAGVTAGAGGALLLLTPRAKETWTVLREGGLISDGLATKLQRVARTATRVGVAAGGIITLGTALAQLAEASYMERIDTGMGRVAKAVIEADSAANAASLDDLFRDRNGDPLINNVDDLDSALRRTFDRTWDESFNDWGSGIINTITGIEGSTQILESAWGRWDQQLSDLVNGGNADMAAESFDILASRAEDLGISTDELNDLFPLYEDALAGADAQQATTATSAEALAAGVGEVAPATEEASEALEDWRDMVSDAYQSFIDLGGAYQGVIDKNRELAERTAEDTESAEDSWTDYYDGVSVSASDYIGQLEAQVEAQEAWATNMSEISGRLAEKMPADMQGAAQAMIDELVELGPEGAAQVQLLHDMSDEELAKVVELYDRKGAASAGAFVSEVESHRDPILDVQDDASEKIAAVREQLLKLPDETTIKVTTDTRVTGPGMTTGGLPWGDGEGAGWTGKLPRGVAQMSQAVKSMDPLARITSGYRPGAITATGYPSYHGMGRAIDIVSPNMGRTWDILRRAFGTQAKELYYTPRGFIRNGRLTTDVAPVTRQTHYSHVHLALASGGRLPGRPPANPREDNLLGVDEHGMPLARVRSREWVISQPASDYYGDRLMSAINERRIPKQLLQQQLPRLAGGGVTAPERLTPPSAPSLDPSVSRALAASATPVQVQANVTDVVARMDPSDFRALAADLVRVADAIASGASSRSINQVLQAKRGADRGGKYGNG